MKHVARVCSWFLFEIEIGTVIDDMLDLKYVEHDFPILSL
jgi:hypothetical protein